jgi:primase-polymerase (primpol)-like protein
MTELDPRGNAPTGDHAQKPTALVVVNPAGIPTALKESKGWVMWRYEQRKGSGKWSKPPYCTDGQRASNTAPHTWTTFDAALAAYEKGGSFFDGIGLVLTGDLVGIDLDHCISSSGVLEEWAAQIVNRFSGLYTERSPGGDGLHIFCRGIVARNGKAGPGNRLEVYSEGSPRFLTVTGVWHEEHPGSVSLGQVHLNWLHALYMTKGENTLPADHSLLPPVLPAAGPTDAPSQVMITAAPVAMTDYEKEGGVAHLSDADLLEKIRNSSAGAAFFALFNGVYTADQDPSALDMRLCGKLAFWTRNDDVRMDALFRRSARMRDKWDERRGDSTYGKITIAKAIAGNTSAYQDGDFKKTKRGAGSNTGEKKTAVKGATPLPLRAVEGRNGSESPTSDRLSDPAQDSVIIRNEGDCTFSRSFKRTRDGVEMPEDKLLLDCSIRLIHSIEHIDDDDCTRLEHVLELNSVREGRQRVRLPAESLSGVESFKVAMQHRRQVFYGSSGDLCHLAHHLFSANPTPPRIRSLNIVGHDNESNAFVFPQFAYTEAGRIGVNGDKFFDRLNVRPFHAFSDPVINGLEPIDITAFAGDLHGAFGNKGLLAMGFWLATLVGHKVFENYGFFPFLSMYGDPHCGKSFLTKLLNRCFFIDNEGITMTGSNTAKGELRRISQRSGLVCPLLEGRKDKTRFDFDSVLALYNRNTLYSRAATSQDNRTHDLKLQTSLAFVWNAELFTMGPAKERVVSLPFREGDLTEATGVHWGRLNELSPEQLANVGDCVLKRRKALEARIITGCKEYANRLKKWGITTARIAENHAILLAGAVLFLELADRGDLRAALEQYAAGCAKSKLETAKNDSELADEFFESIRWFNSAQGVLETDDQVLVHLPTVISALHGMGNSFHDRRGLIAELKANDRFIEKRNGREFGVQRETYRFKKQKLDT